MAKRFTDTNKYKKPFIRGLKGAYKLLWDYLYHDCNHAGIWIVDFDIAQIYLGNDMPVSKELALEYFNSDEIRIIEIDNGKKWFIPSFIDFQYSELNENNRAHNSVISILLKENLYDSNKGLIRGLYAPKEKDKDKDKVKDKVNPSFFEIEKYGNEKGYNLPVQKIIDFYTNGGELNYWIDSNGKKVVRWKSKISSVWFKDEFKMNSSQVYNHKNGINLNDFKIPHSDNFGFTKNELIERCKKGIYEKV